MAELVELRDKLTLALAPVVGDMGFDLLDLEWKPEQSGWILRIILDHPARSITIKDCETVSREASAFLDESGLIERQYNLEVSSPGLRRPLKSLRDYERFLGARARIELRSAPEGLNQKVFLGTIEAASEGRIRLAEGPRRWEFEIREVHKANLDPDINI